MSILNYTTAIKVEKTMAEIQMLLARAKVQCIMTEYDPQACPAAVSFKVLGPYGILCFRLPANIDKILLVMQRDNKIPRGLKTRDQAARVGWRIIKDWLEAQLSIISAEMVTLEQVFLPYVQNSQGDTIYEVMSANNFNNLALPAPKQ